MRKQKQRRNEEVLFGAIFSAYDSDRWASNQFEVGMLGLKRKANTNKAKTMQDES